MWVVGVSLLPADSAPTEEQRRATVYAEVRRAALRAHGPVMRLMRTAEAGELAGEDALPWDSPATRQRLGGRHTVPGDFRLLRSDAAGIDGRAAGEQAAAIVAADLHAGGYPESTTEDAVLEILTAAAAKVAMEREGGRAGGHLRAATRHRPLVPGVPPAQSAEGRAEAAAQYAASLALARAEVLRPVSAVLRLVRGGSVPPEATALVREALRRARCPKSRRAEAASVLLGEAVALSAPAQHRRVSRHAEPSATPRSRHATGRETAPEPPETAPEPSAEDLARVREPADLSVARMAAEIAQVEDLLRGLGEGDSWGLGDAW